VHSWLAKRGYRLVKIDSEESSPSNAQKKSEVKQITCENKKTDANEENSSLIVSPTTEAHRNADYNGP
jgi:UDP-N-acetylmuramoylalanine-D-glutamate ligase